VSAIAYFYFDQILPKLVGQDGRQQGIAVVDLDLDRGVWMPIVPGPARYFAGICLRKGAFDMKQGNRPGRVLQFAAGVRKLHPNGMGLTVPQASGSRVAEKVLAVAHTQVAQILTVLVGWDGGQQGVAIINIHAEGAVRIILIPSPATDLFGINGFQNPCFKKDVRLTAEQHAED
jgi:hypothetical protein